MADYSYHQYSSPWWAKYYGPPMIFEYVGNHAAFLEYVNKVGVITQLAKVLGRRVRIANVINALADIKLIDGKDKSPLLEDVLDIYTRHDAAKTLSEWLSAETRRATTSGRYFSSVGKCHYSSETPLTPKAFKAIDDKFVIVSGTLCRRSALSTNPALLEAASHSDCDWVLCGFPPVAMTDSNSDYDGSVVNVRLDEGFDAVFSGRVPFDPEIAWFPKCVVAGFFNSRKVTTENFPTIRPSLIQYQRPISPTPNARDLSKFVEGELKHPIYLKDFSSRVYLYYLLPAMYRSWGVGYDKVDSTLRADTLRLAQKDVGSLDPTLQQLYSARFGLDVP